MLAQHRSPAPLHDSGKVARAGLVGGLQVCRSIPAAAWRASAARLESDTEQTTLPQIRCVLQREVQWG
jgi:hypothetical protein